VLSYEGDRKAVVTESEEGDEAPDKDRTPDDDMSESTGKKPKYKPLGVMHGNGLARFVGGNTYEGSFSNGMMHGSGRYTFTSSNIVYKGDVAYNVLTGEGSFKWGNGDVYVGAVLNGVRHGFGTFTSNATGAVYEGGWLNGVREGKGTLWFTGEKSATEPHYSGGWKKNQRHGVGKIRYASGNIYEGEWELNQKNGEGVMVWEDSNEVYAGQWKNDKQHGEGTHIWKEEDFNMGDTTKQRCNRYEGEWREGVRHGTGTFFYANGSQYYGQWKNNVKDGFGCLTFSSGAVWEGIFKNDRMPAKEGRESEAVEAQIKLNISDIMKDGNSTMGGGGHELMLLEKMLLRFHTELKVVYRHYAGMQLHSHPPPSPAGSADQVHQNHHSRHNYDAKSSFTLTMNQLRIMCAECRITDQATLSFATVAEIFYRMRRTHALHVASAWEEGQGTPLVYDEVLHEGKKSKFDLTRNLLFREFVEGLVRIAYHKFVNIGGKVSIGEAVNFLMEDHLRVFATQTGLNPFEERLRESKVAQSLEKNSPLLNDLWLVYASEGGDFMKMSSFAAFCADCSNFGNCKGFSLDEIKSIVGDSIVGGGRRNHGQHLVVQSLEEAGDGRLLYEEFLEAVVRMSNLVFVEQKPLSDKTNRLCVNIISELLNEIKKVDDEKQVKKNVAFAEEDPVAADTGGEEKKDGGEEEEKTVETVVPEPPKITLKGKALKAGGKRRPPRRV